MTERGREWGVVPAEEEESTVDVKVVAIQVKVVSSIKQRLDNRIETIYFIDSFHIETMFH